MPSFSCDGCGDVVKKPKLDSHTMRCRSSVTCLDCSTTFTNHTSWKGHTSCISEAQKYQKSLYKPPKSNNKSNGKVESNNLKNNAPTLISETSPTPASTNSTSGVVTSTHQEKIKSIDQTEPINKKSKEEIPTIDNQAVVVVVADDEKKEKKLKKKDKKRNRQNQDEVALDEKTNNPKTNEAKGELNEEENKTNENIREKKKLKTDVVVESSKVTELISNEISQKKNQKKGEDSELKVGLPDGEKEKEPTRINITVETNEKKSNKKKEKKKIHDKTTLVEEEGKANCGDEHGLNIEWIDAGKIIQQTQEIILSSNGKSMTLNDLIKSNLKYILDNKNKKESTDNLTNKTEEEEEEEEKIRYKIQQIFLDNLHFNPLNSFHLSWNSSSTST